MAYYFVKKNKRIPKYAKKITGIVIICSGISLLFYFFFPLFLYQVIFGFTNQSIDSPIPKYAMVTKDSGLASLFTQGISSLTTDFTDARNWYPNIQVSKSQPASKYLLSIPALKINNAEVSTVDYDLTRHLIQYAGTSLPGENGTSVIFGHSTLPQLFDPKNYKTIFANLHKIKNGDSIVADVGGVKYTYKVFSVSITSPEDTNMFEQSFDHSYITIITCTPPGTIWKRLIVRANLEDIGKTSRVGEVKKSLLAGSFSY